MDKKNMQVIIKRIEVCLKDLRKELNTKDKIKEKK